MKGMLLGSTSQESVDPVGHASSSLCNQPCHVPERGDHD